MGSRIVPVSTFAASTSTLPDVGQITKNYQVESPLHPKAREILGDAIDQGWADPRKLSQASARARILRDEAVSALSHGLGVPHSQLEFIGESSQSNYYAVAGLLGPTDHLIHSALDRKEIHALGQKHEHTTIVPVNAKGHIDINKELSELHADLIALQVSNIETGVTQPVESIIHELANSRIALDFTAAPPSMAMPSRWDSAAFDSVSWQGPVGLGVIAIAPSSNWRNPMPHIGAARTPESFSLPLLLASSVALSAWQEEEKVQSSLLRDLTTTLRNQILTQIPGSSVAGDIGSSLPNISSICFVEVEAEELLRKLDARGFLVDAGSACFAENIQASHVLAAMGAPSKGNIRITFHHGTRHEDVTALVEAISACVSDLRTDSKFA